jgi:hypothetical protein
MVLSYLILGPFQAYTDIWLHETCKWFLLVSKFSFFYLNLNTVYVSFEDFCYISLKPCMGDG